MKSRCSSRIHITNSRIIKLAARVQFAVITVILMLRLIHILCFAREAVGAHLIVHVTLGLEGSVMPGLPRRAKLSVLHESHRICNGAHAVGNKYPSWTTSQEEAEKADKL